MFVLSDGLDLNGARPELTPLPVSQTLTSCQMLPVTVTGSAFDRKIVSVLPVSFCLSFRFIFHVVPARAINQHVKQRDRGMKV